MPSGCPRPSLSARWSWTPYPAPGGPLAWSGGLYLFSISRREGIALLVYGVLVISMIDNILKPLILKGAAQVHMLLGCLSILGGLYAFGFKGLIVGPVVLSLVMSAFRIYRQDILRWRHEVGTGRTGAFAVIPAAEEQTRPPSSSARRLPCLLASVW